MRSRPPVLSRLLLAVLASTACASSATSSASSTAVPIGGDHVVAVMEENVVGGRAWLGGDLVVRALAMKGRDGELEHALLVDAPGGGVATPPPDSLIVQADDRRLALAALDEGNGGAIEAGLAQARLFPLTLDELSTIASARRVVVHWGDGVTRKFNRENQARFRRWAADVGPGGALVTAPAAPAVESAATSTSSGHGGGSSATALETPAVPERRVRVIVPAANLRAGPGTSHPVVTVLVRGVVLTVVDQRGAWLEVSGDEVHGFLHQWTLEELGSSAAGP